MEKAETETHDEAYNFIKTSRRILALAEVVQWTMIRLGKCYFSIDAWGIGLIGTDERIAEIKIVSEAVLKMVAIFPSIETSYKRDKLSTWRDSRLLVQINNTHSSTSEFAARLVLL